MAFTNTSPISYPTRSAQPALGTNPLSVGAPGVGGDGFCLDMATTTVAVGKVGLLENSLIEGKLNRVNVSVGEES